MGTVIEFAELSIIWSKRMLTTAGSRSTSFARQFIKGVDHVIFAERATCISKNKWLDTLGVSGVKVRLASSQAADVQTGKSESGSAR
jgi:hypothetical protein